MDQYEKNLKNQKTMIAEFNHFDINERIIDFFQNLFIVKKKLTDKRIIHYFEWGNKNIHFYDVISHKQSKYLVSFITASHMTSLIFCVTSAEHLLVVTLITLTCFNVKLKLYYRNSLLDVILIT